MKRGGKTKVSASVSELKKLRKTKNSKTGRFYTLQEIGDTQGVCRERIRQLIGNTGVVNKSGMYRTKVKCFFCGKIILREKRLVGERNFCNRKCFAKFRIKKHGGVQRV